MSRARANAAVLGMAVTLACCAAASWTATARAATPSPVWSISIRPLQTNLAPGVNTSCEGNPCDARASWPQLRLVATNVGGAPTSGQITITDTLPSGLTFSTVQPVGGDDTNGNLSRNDVSCGVSGQTVTCTDSGVTPLQPTDAIDISIPVDVAPDASGPVTDLATASGGGAAQAAASQPVGISASDAPFDFVPGTSGFNSSLLDSDGSPVIQAGSHPWELTVTAGFATKRVPGEGGQLPSLKASGNGLRDLTLNLPRGLVVNPTSTPVRCTEAQLESDKTGGGCPDASQVGVVQAFSQPGKRLPPSPLYNMVPPRGVPAELAFDAVLQQIYVHLFGAVRTGSDYGISSVSSDVPAFPVNAVYGIQAELWGNPSDPAFDYVRTGSDCSTTGATACPVPATTTPFLTMPSACQDSLTTTASADSWADPGELKPASFTSGMGVTGCGRLRFNPSITVRPDTSVADSPSGLSVDLKVPQSDSLDTLATANLKDARVTLPEGMAIDPAAAEGLAACSPEQIGLDDEKEPTCPDASKIGTVSIDSPLLPDPLTGSVFEARQDENPFGSLLAIYVTAEADGVLVKLAGHVEAEPTTGRLTATFKENPQLPFTELSLRFFGGNGAPLVNPQTCGQKTTTTELTPWSAPRPVTSTDSFDITSGANGGPCPASEAAEPNAPSLEAGTSFTNAGAYSPFVLRLSREDGSQRLAGIDLSLPPGLTGRLAGIPYCSEAQIAQAESRSRPGEGRLEQANPSCPDASGIGTVDVAAGAGSTPVHVQGKAYLAGPYKGAPLSMVIITPAVAGPFDLGVVVVRTALHVDPATAQISASSDEIPHILEGIPLDVRSIALSLDRSQFTLNPTSCEAMAITGQAISTTGAVAQLRNRFQVGGCRGLAFSPKLRVNLKGGTRRNGNPALVATLTQGAGQANIAFTSVALPHSEFLEQGHIKTLCTRVQFAARQCPKASIYGHAEAVTPLLEQPLRGPVYLRSSSHRLPDLVAALRGPATQPIEIDLDGRIDSHKGGIRTTFEAVPDAPVTKFVLRMQGGKKSLLVNSTNICRGKHKVTVRMTGHNGAQDNFRTPLKARCGKQSKKHAGHARRKHKG